MLEHTQLAEMHAQSSVALKSLAEQREAMRAESEAHRKTEQQLIALHETMQAERQAYSAEMSADREARAQLPLVQAELAATRQMLEKAGRETTLKGTPPWGLHGADGSAAGAPWSATAGRERSPKTPAQSAPTSSTQATRDLFSKVGWL